MDQDWDSEIGGLLTELSAAQDDLLALLAEKRRLLVAADGPGMAALQPREGELMRRLQACHDHRGELLGRAAAQGLPGDSVRSLASALPRGAGEKRALSRRFDEAASRTDLLRHQSLANWVVTQRSLLHLSQLLELIATGGRRQPTYERGTPRASGGSLVDEAV